MTRSKVIIGVVVIVLLAAMLAGPTVVVAIKGKEVRHPDDEESLGRIIVSEEGSKPDIIKRAVAWAVRNEAYRRGVSITALAKKSTHRELDGRYGGQSEQASDGIMGYRFASSRFAATPAARLIAQSVLRLPRSADPTRGATQFDSPKAQRALLAKGQPGYTKTPEDVAKSRMASGKRLVTLPGVDPEEFRMWA